MQLLSRAGPAGHRKLLRAATARLQAAGGPAGLQAGSAQGTFEMLLEKRVEDWAGRRLGMSV